MDENADVGAKVIDVAAKDIDSGELGNGWRGQNGDNVNMAWTAFVRAW